MNNKKKQERERNQSNKTNYVYEMNYKYMTIIRCIRAHHLLHALLIIHPARLSSAIIS